MRWLWKQGGYCCGEVGVRGRSRRGCWSLVEGGVGPDLNILAGSWELGEFGATTF